jgi:hypothetical protein
MIYSVVLVNVANDAALLLLTIGTKECPGRNSIDISQVWLKWQRNQNGSSTRPL